MNFKYFKTSSLIPFILVLSVIFNIISKKIEGAINSNGTLGEIYSYIGVFSTITLITITLSIINFWAWKWAIFKWLINIPNLNGRYTGELISSFTTPQGTPVRKICVMEIKQTASKIYIHSYFGDVNPNAVTSSSQSVSEELVSDTNGMFRLYYIFTNESNALQVQLNNHLGTARFRYFLDIKTLEGEYYNQRMNFGTIKVVFEQETLLGRLIR